ncbi:MAG: dicarboxylate/amino acid:cation symporter [Dethiosulfovibrio peptidovorans]|nr:MAG: dicarboxylate/amino acid:cation symporter [Dethiosulfovibrio peptidovorans]
MFWVKMPLHKKIFLMIILGAGIGYFMGPDAVKLKPIGDAFIRLLKMLIVPLVFFTISSGITKMETPRNLRKIGGFVVTFYALTSLLAAFIGTVVALTIRPGQGIEGILGSAKEISVAKYSFVDTILNWIPTNPVAAMANMSMIQIIFFAILFGLAILLLGEKAKLMANFVTNGADVMIKITDFVMSISPYGIGALVAVLVGTISDKMVLAVIKFIVTDYLSIFIVFISAYPLILRWAKVPVFNFFKTISPAMLVAATTTSSAATLPISLDIAEHKMGIHPSIFGFALPLGSTVNMNGMAVALGVISVFSFDIYGFEITPLLLTKVVFLGLVLAVGAAGVKGAGIVMSAVLFESLNMPLELVPILAAIWPVIDIAHTTANITGDLVVTRACSARLGNKMEKQKN